MTVGGRENRKVGFVRVLKWEGNLDGRELWMEGNFGWKGGHFESNGRDTLKGRETSNEGQTSEGSEGKNRGGSRRKTEIKTDIH